MATVTPNFNWPVPTSTDLVKDGATAIEALGDSIDASLVDLKGGTTGQVLAKASNTDLDYTWTDANPGDITGVTVSSPLTGGGTSGTVTVGILSGTTSNLGAVQLSDSTSSTSTTLAATANAVKTTYDLANSAYAPAFTNNYYAGKNKIINGDFFINQRAFSSTTTTGTFGFDRWFTGFAGGTVTYSNQAFTAGAAPVAGYEGATFARLVTASQSAAGDYATLQQKVEDVRTFAGQTVTYSFWAKASSGTPNIGVTMVQDLGVGGTGGNTITSPAVKPITTSWARYSFNITMPSLSGKTIGTSSKIETIIFTSNGTTLSSLGYAAVGVQNATIDIWGVQMEAGSTATPFATASGGSIESELAMCQRYYVRFTGSGTSPQVLTAGISVTSTLCNSWVNMPVTMRTTPTAVEFSALNVTDLVNYNLAVSNVTVDANTSTPSFFFGTITHASSATVNRLAVIRGQNSSGYIGISAEL